MRARVLRVGLTGGVASGKSTVARLLRERGASVTDADELVADLYWSGAPGAAAVATLFGPGALDRTGAVDRAALGALVLADLAARRSLEAAVHPLVRQRIGDWFAALASASVAPVVAVVEAALLAETGAYREYDRVVVVSAALEVRRSRALAAGWTAERFERVVAAQVDNAAHEAVADHVIRNDGDLAALARLVDELWAHLVHAASIG
jgi:dephospho-CoA kinase